MEYPPGVPFYNRENSPDLLGTGKPPFLTALTLILELSFYFGQHVYLIVDTMHRRHAAYRIFTPQFITYLIGHEGPGVCLPYSTPRFMVEYAVGILKIIIDLCDNFCTCVAIVEKLDHDGYHKVSRDMIVTIMSWYARYRAV